MKEVSNMKKIFAENLKHHLDRRRLNQTDMAKDLNFPETTVSNWMKASTYPRPDKLQLMADYFNVSRSDLTEKRPDNLVHLSPQTVRVPVLGDIACGDPIHVEENFIGYRFVSPDRLPSGNSYYLIAKGNSMEPTIPNGSEVLIREQEEVEYGQIAAVLVNGNSEATLKRVRKQGDLVVLMPDNPTHEPIFVTEDCPVKIIGKAIRVERDL